LYGDLPGLDDVSMRPLACAELEKGLKEGYRYKLLFVCMQNSGRIPSSDLTTIRLILEAIPPSVCFSIIVNQCSVNFMVSLKKVLSTESPITHQDTFENLLKSGLPRKPENILYFPLVNAAIDADNFIIPVSGSPAAVTSTVSTSSPTVASTVSTSSPTVASTVSTRSPAVTSTVSTSSPAVTSTVSTSSRTVASTVSTSSPAVASTVSTSSPAVTSTVSTSPAGSEATQPGITTLMDLINEQPSTTIENVDPIPYDSFEQLQDKINEEQISRKEEIEKSVNEALKKAKEEALKKANEEALEKANEEAEKKAKEKDENKKDKEEENERQKVAKRLFNSKHTWAFPSYTNFGEKTTDTESITFNTSTSRQTVRVIGMIFSFGISARDDNLLSEVFISCPESIRDVLSSCFDSSDGQLTTSQISSIIESNDTWTIIYFRRASSMKYSSMGHGWQICIEEVQ